MNAREIKHYARDEKMSVCQNKYMGNHCQQFARDDIIKKLPANDENHPNTAYNLDPREEMSYIKNKQYEIKCEFDSESPMGTIDQRTLKKSLRHREVDQRVQRSNLDWGTTATIGQREHPNHDRGDGDGDPVPRIESGELRNDKIKRCLVCSRVIRITNPLIRKKS